MEQHEISLIIDALKEYAGRREPVWDYVKSRYGDHSSDFQAYKAASVCSKLQVAKDLIHRLEQQPVEDKP